MRRMGLTQPGVGIDRLYPHGAEQPRHTFVMHRLSLTPHPGGHPTHAIVRRDRVLLIQ